MKGRFINASVQVIGEWFYLWAASTHEEILLGRYKGRAKAEERAAFLNKRGAEQRIKEAA